MSGLSARVRALLPGRQPGEELLSELLTQAGQHILHYTGRREVPPELHTAQVQLAVVLYNRLGTEGESIRREGGALMHFEGLPRMLEAQLRPWRLGRAVP